MRATAVAFLATAAVAAAVGFLVRWRGASQASPLAVTVVAALASLWIGFSAARDADGRLDRIRRAFAVHGDEERLLRDHWLVYLVVGLRLEMMVLAGLLVSMWGLGPRIGVWLVVLGGLMMALTWPTRRKIQLLLGRARALREG
jgi:hypothetical protein